MIKIKRAGCPEYLRKPDDQFHENDYKKPEVTKTIIDMQYGKCCFCERLLREMGRTERWGEHFTPRNAFNDADGNIQWHLANKWENLLYSCGTCNGAKGSQNPFNDTTGVLEIIDPSLDLDPEEHIHFAIDGYLISYVEKRGSSLGRSTIEKLKLSTRIDLIRVFRRIKAEVENHFAEIINALESEDQPKIEQLKGELTRFMSAHESYAAFRRALIKKRIDELNNRDIPMLTKKYGKTFDSISIDFPKGYELRT